MRIWLSMIVLAVACGGPTKTGDALRPPPTPTCPPVAAAPVPLDEAAVKDKSHAFFDAMDRADSAAIKAAAAPGFVEFRSQRFFEPDMIAQQLDMRSSKHLAPRTRTWEDEHVYLSSGGATYIGLATEHTPGEDGKTDDQDGWYTLVWVRDGAGWKVAHFQWQKGGLDVERDVWNDVYREGKRFKQGPNQLLIDATKGRHPGTALDLGMGQGRNAIYLAERGWKVTGIDISDEGIHIATENAARKKLKLETVRANMETWDLGKEKWDLVTMIYEGSDAEMIDRVKPSIKKGGLFVLEYFSAESAMAPKMGIGGVKRGELAESFKKDGFKILRDDVVEDVSDFGMMKDKLQRFVAEKL